MDATTNPVRPFVRSVGALLALISSAGCVGEIYVQPGREAGHSHDAHVGDATRDAFPSQDAAPEADPHDAASPPVDAGHEPDVHLVVVDASAPDVAPPPVVCGEGCGDHSHCHPDTGRCECDPYFTATASGCEPNAAVDPAMHTTAEVCSRWNAAHMENGHYTMPSGTCGTGALDRAAVDDALLRLNMFRWMVGLGPSSDDETRNAADQSCSMMEAIHGWPSATNTNPHHPDTSWECYSADGAGAAGLSNIAWGNASAAGSVDQFIDDRGNETTLGHRRWLFNPPLDGVGIGYFAAAGEGSASCFGVIGGGGDGPRPQWIAWPPPGPVPSSAPITRWSFHAATWDLSAAVVTVTANGTAMPVSVRVLNYAIGYPAIGITPMGWYPMAGTTYHVAVANLTGFGMVPDRVEYDVSVVSCL